MINPIDERPTPGPWYLITNNDTHFTAIATKPIDAGSYDPDNGVLSTSEWLIVNRPDLERMARVPDMEAEIERLQEALSCLTDAIHRYDSDPKSTTIMAKYAASLEHACGVLSSSYEHFPSPPSNGTE